MMKNACEAHGHHELKQLCASVRALVIDGDFESCMEPIRQAMARYPDAPHPHNLMGIVLEKTGDHAGAMKHFRAAWALDPTYRPANHNMYKFGTFYSRGKCAFDESDIPTEAPSLIQIIHHETSMKPAANQPALHTYQVSHAAGR